MKREKRILVTGILMIGLFVVWTKLVCSVDVQKLGETNTEVGFATFNSFFHKLTGVHMWVYTVTDWLGFVPIFVCLLFGVLGLIQLIKRKSLKKVDLDIVFLGIYYIVVILSYLVFEMVPVNYRPILIEGYMEASYPSSTTLLVLSVMPTIIFQANRRLQKFEIKIIVKIAASIFSLFMVIGRLLTGVHWFTDIVGSVLLSSGLFCVYYAFTLLCCEK